MELQTHPTLPPRPFTVIGGFLGSGKTTVVNRILGQANGTRFAVMVNDFGAVNVDLGLIAAHDGQTMALTNGCICCSLADGFVQAMLRLMTAPERFDHVIVEASGVAQPARIMDFARLDPQLSPDAIVTLVDAAGVAERMADPLITDAVAAQISSADLLVLNKTDLVDSGGRSAARRLIAGLNGDAPVLEAAHGAVPLDALLGTALSGHAGDRVVTLPDDPAFATVLVRADGPVDRAAFERWADALPPQVLRGKGRVILTEGPRLWQKVGARAELSVDRAEGAGTEIVLIGTGPFDPRWPFG